MSDLVSLSGIAWDHPRGIGPLQATIPDYREVAPGIEIRWEARSLLGFGEDPIEILAADHDLLVIDHPFVGTAARMGVVEPLDRFIRDASLDALAKESVGPSFASYGYDGHVWALPIDAAAQVSAWRPDLMGKHRVPVSWSDVLDLAVSLRSSGLAAAMPMIHTDLVPTFLSLAANSGEPALQEPNQWVLSPGRLDRVLDMLLMLRDVLDPRSLILDPPGVFDEMGSSDVIAYCPLAFGYSNYARIGFRSRRIRFGNMPSIDGRPHGATLGGAGIAVSRYSVHPWVAARYALWLASGAVQRTGYFEGGGQPAHRAAWLDPALNEVADQFFTRTIATLDAAFVRPRWPGYLLFQDAAGPALHAFVSDTIGRRELKSRLDRARIAALRERFPWGEERA